MGPTTTTALHQPQLQQLYSKEATSKPFFPKTTTSTTTQSKWAAAATPTAFHQPTFGSIIRQHHNVTASPRLSSSSSQHGKHVNGFSARVARHHGLQEWIEGRNDEDTRLQKRKWRAKNMSYRNVLSLLP